MQWSKRNYSMALNTSGILLARDGGETGREMHWVSSEGHLT